MFFSKAFLIAVLQGHGRSQGISIDALTFTHHVISDTTAMKDEEFSIIIQKKLNIVRRACRYWSTSEVGKSNHSFIQSIHQSVPQENFVPHLPRAPPYTRH